MIFGFNVAAAGRPRELTGRNGLQAQAQWGRGRSAAERICNVPPELFIDNASMWPRPIGH